jgi:adenylate kinase family enzyme
VPPQRILVIGCSGAGKSTLGRALAGRYGLPLIHLDHEYWLPGWGEPRREVWRETVKGLVARDAWVMEGNYSSTFDIRMPRADMIVFLDMPVITCLRGILWRPLRHWGKQRPDMAPGCIERYDWPFVKYVWLFRQKQRPVIVAALERYGKTARLAHLKSRSEARAFLQSLPGEAGAKAA